MAENAADAPSSARQKPRLASLDLLRAAATVAVVIIHASAAVLLNAAPTTRGYQVAAFLNQFSRFAVPAFVLMAGAGLFFNYGARERFSPGRYYVRRLQSLGIPYLFWSILYYVVYRWTEQDFQGFVPGLLGALASANAIYTFYFFPIIAPFYLLFPLVRPLARSRWLGLAALAAIVGNGYLIWFGFPHPKAALGPLLSALYPYAGNTPLWWMGPFFLGAWLVAHWDTATARLRRDWPGLLAAAGGLLVWVLLEFRAYVQVGKLAYVATNFRPSAYIYGLVIMSAILGLGSVLAERSGWFVHLCLSLSKYSFAIYLVHPLVMQNTAGLLSRMNVGPLIHFTVQILVVLGLSYALARLIDLLPGGGWLIGRSGSRS